jgi:hypothetical protein
MYAANKKRFNQVNKLFQMVFFDSEGSRRDGLVVVRVESVP